MCERCSGYAKYAIVSIWVLRVRNSKEGYRTIKTRYRVNYSGSATNKFGQAALGSSTTPIIGLLSQKVKVKPMIVPKSRPNHTPREAAPPPQVFEPLLNSREAAALLRMHHKTLERWARRKEIPGYFYNGRWFFRTSELDGWLHSAVHCGSQSVRENWRAQ